MLVHRCYTPHSAVYIVHNLSSRPATITVDVGPGVACLHDLLTNQVHQVAENGYQQIELEPYGYRWFREEHTPEP